MLSWTGLHVGLLPWLLLVAVGILWVFVALLPVLNIIPIGVLMAERPTPVRIPLIGSKVNYLPYEHKRGQNIDEHRWTRTNLR